ncbi:MAG: nicotinate phosphoribosyltransferase, partial [bacterium]|nr:nicotinate phosphoribosyltransferase [bacterium]
SDGINNMELCKEIANYCRKQGLPFSLGIGTWFTCDVPEVTRLNQVMKMTSMSLSRQGDDWTPVIKIADGVGKEIGDPGAIHLAKLTLDIKETIPA